MKTVFRLTLWFIGILLMPVLQAATTQGPLVLGAERMDVITRLLKDKQVGLVINQTSILEKQQKHLLDALVEKGIQVKKVFAPEHGFRGTADAGEEVKDSRDLKTGIPIVSIYGKNKKPTAEQLNGLDVIVFDIQDVGARFYTYISTMHYVMEACAENGVEFIVLDRPNPNDFVDGPIRQKGFESFVGVDPIPLLHGLTVGELAWMINSEGWLKSSPDSCKLHIVKMENWKHGDPYWLPVKPSPNLPNDQSIRLYPSLCFFEATNVSVGRGTYYPFQVIGYPDRKYGDFAFTPVSLPGFDTNPLQKDKECYGIDLREYPFEGGLTLRFFLDFYNKAGNEQAFFFSRPQWFDLLAGTKELRYQIVRGLTEEEIRESWQPELDKYKQMRKKYLLYPDYPQKTIKNR
ncbi:DUF1343 domain-containing protein [Parabacteroides segnis]|jgi:uncharacterized protein YbbC (DUF1343 family)|uniref:DUF1343 domain-containing protein n=1 Tax=Parabacteroides segnis TaxID=2763058 RepID=A0ABR7E1P4_9BACT|nr:MULTISPECIES: DUF1343 domain-containing protein [Parabacteroides]MBC5642984.1 DUF1343 domain-containing protein [Parabacteroides segnis]MCM0713135.1 DUF1343 domain-containing protein [Parabacteroides sp. TA-V-105]